MSWLQTADIALTAVGFVCLWRAADRLLDSKDYGSWFLVLGYLLTRMCSDLLPKVGG
jgi:hypothetical protein